MFEHLKVPISVYEFHHEASKRAHDQLLDFVDDYFSRDLPDRHAKLQKTHRAPIFFQQPGHSMTIVGFEHFEDGSRNLLVFDPSFAPATALRAMLKNVPSVKASRSKAGNLLETYRCSSVQLDRYDAFEVLV
jgi:hypothetical protein